MIVFQQLFISLLTIEYDLLPRYYCCQMSRDPAFCDFYYEKRPAGTCDGYLPPRTGTDRGQCPQIGRQWGIKIETVIALQCKLNGKPIVIFIPYN